MHCPVRMVTCLWRKTRSLSPWNRASWQRRRHSLRPRIRSSCLPPRGSRSPITDRYLCPVRAIKIYLKRTKKLRQNRLRFFIPTLSTRDVSKATISRWICRAITTAYAGLSSIPRSRFGTRAHEVRAVATSWAFRSGVPLSRIMQAASWRHHNTFSRFYLRSLTTQSQDLLQLVH